MIREKFALLHEELKGLQSAANHLGYSIERCHGLIFREEMPLEELERLESLTSRFARLTDLLTQRIFRLIDEIELAGTGTLLDRIYRAEKRGWGGASELIKIRELRNLIAHEYASDKMPEIYAVIIAMSPALLAVVPQVVSYANELSKRYSGN